MAILTAKEYPALQGKSKEEIEKFWAMILTPPRTNYQLQQWVYKVLGLWISDVQVCENHVAPLTAFSDAYFARYPRIVWKGSRGLGGKTVMLAALSLTEIITLGAGVTLLGGSGEQSRRVHKYMGGEEMTDAFWNGPYAPRHLLRSDPTQRETYLKNGGWMNALMASSASVRGPHPQRLRGDEIDEMDQKIWDAASGQPMSAKGVESQITGSSTHHYADGTMTEEIKRAHEKGFPVYEWCMMENLRIPPVPPKDDLEKILNDPARVETFLANAQENPMGWLTWNEVLRKNSQVSNAMWMNEYLLHEPSIEGRAISTPAVDAMFKKSLGYYKGEMGCKLIFEPPVAGATYAAGADWGKMRDKSIFIVLRTDVKPNRIVAFYHLGRQAYPIMIGNYDNLVQRYDATAAFDLGGVGTVIVDYVESEGAAGVTLQGRKRTEAFDDTVVEIENGAFESPMIESLHTALKYVTGDDLYDSKGHPPDFFIALVLANYAKEHLGRKLFY